MSVADFQAASSAQGRAFEQASQFVLLADGYTILGLNSRPDPFYPTVDIVAESPDGIETWCECKGSHRGRNQRGLERLTTVKVAVGVAYDLAGLRIAHEAEFGTPVRYLILTSHLPTAPLAIAMLERAVKAGVIDEVKLVGMR